MNNQKIISLRMKRHFVTYKANEDEYIQLYHATKPRQIVYLNGLIFVLDSKKQTLYRPE